jgi:hypothetical protein
MKIRRKNDHSIQVQVDCAKALGEPGHEWWRWDDDTAIKEYYSALYWEEAPDEPRWVEVDLGAASVNSDMNRLYIDGKYPVSIYDNHLRLRLDEGWVKVSELEKWFTYSTISVPLIRDWIYGNQRPMLIVEKREDHHE